MKITHCKLKKSIQKKLLQFFVLEVTARSAADLSGIHPNSAVLFYRKIREVISHHLSLEADTVFDGSVELDESYFGGHRKGKRGRGAADKVAVFGILKRGGKVYTVVIENAKRETLFPVITKKIMPDSIVYTDCLSSYDVLDVSGFSQQCQSCCRLALHLRHIRRLALASARDFNHHPVAMQHTQILADKAAAGQRLKLGYTVERQSVLQQPAVIRFKFHPHQVGHHF